MRPNARRRAKIVQALLAGATQRAAVAAAGYRPSVARSRSGEIVRLPEVQSLLTEAMRAAGLTPDGLARSVREALDATVLVSAPDGCREVADHKIRLQAYDRAVHAFGYAQPAETVPSPPAVHLTIQFVEPGTVGGEP
ncbi:MAG: hypothetical protein KGK07_16100 [Chloroflexota bacterium]|nr:hypothetical protein [Chloroflexota bacterium]